MDTLLESYCLTPSLICGLLILIFVYLLTSKNTKKNLPPGPHPLPLLGTIYAHGVNVTADRLTQLSRTYGGIFSIFLGPQHVVVLNSYDVIHDAMTRPAEFAHRGFSDKYTWRLIRTPKLHGMITKDYSEALIRDRNLSIAILRKLGVGKTVIEDKILQEIEALVPLLSFQNEQGSNPRDLIHTSITNVTLHILLNKRFEHGDEKVKELLQHMENFISYIVYTTIIDSMPALRFIPPFSTILRKFVSGSLGVSEFMKTHAKPLFEDFDPDYGTESFMQSYFESKYDRSTGRIDVDLDAFKYVLGDFLTGGVETSATVICWTLIYLANRPAIQEKLYAELATHTAANTPIRMADTERMPYLQAVTREVQRYGTITTLIPHQSCDRHVTLGGYCIPKNTMLLLNLHGPPKDGETWGDPFIFRPERFIGEDGQFVKEGHVIPFSVGKRACPGKILARQEVFLFTVNLIKKFRFSPPDGIDRIDEDPIRRTTWSPKPFKIKIVPR